LLHYIAAIRHPRHQGDIANAIDSQSETVTDRRNSFWFLTAAIIDGDEEKQRVHARVVMK
jgi:hypothetical protein